MGTPVRPGPRRTRPPILALCVAALLAAGCPDSAHFRSPDAAGGQALSRYQEGPASAGAPAAPSATRFERLAEAQPEPGEKAAESEAGPAAAPAGEEAGPRAEQSLLGPQAAPARVTLEECLKQALAHNLQIQIARYGPAISQAAVLEAEALFDPSWFMNNAVSRIRQDAGSELLGATVYKARQWQFSTGIDSLLPTGGTVGVTQQWTRLDSNSFFITPDPQYSTEASVSLTQPLLQGAGSMVARSPIVLARLDHTISLADFKARLMDVLLEVEQTYWQLVLAQRRVQALDEALNAAAENGRVARMRFEGGKATRLIVSLAESAVTQRQADLIAARLDLAQTSDRLKRLINSPDLPLKEPALLEATELPLTDPIPVNREVLQQAMLAAIENRPELDQAKARLDQTDLQERVARHERLPRLDFVAMAGLKGLDGGLGGAMDEQSSTDFYEWSFGAEIQVPIGNRARRAAYTRAQLEKDQAVKEREDLRQQVLLEVSEAVRNLAAAEESVLATRAARQAAEQTLADQQANVTAGAALVKDLLDAQRDLADAKVREIQSMVDYMTALAALERAKGTLLQYNGIRLAEEGP